MKSLTTSVLAGLVVFSMVSILAGVAGECCCSDDADITLTEQGSRISQFDRKATEFFVENLGQWSSDVKFIARTSFGYVGLGTDGAWYVQDFGLPDETNPELPPIRQVMRLSFIGCNDVRPEGLGLLPHKSNYFLGSDSSKWVADAPNYEQVIYEGIWDGVSLIYAFGEDGLKYEFHVSPGTEVSRIQIAVEGGRPESHGSTLELAGPSGSITDASLRAYLQASGTSVDCTFATRDDCYSFDTPRQTYDETLVIDPLVYSTYIGGTALESADSSCGIEVDSTGAIYVGSETASTDFPTKSGSYDTSYNGGSYDVFVMKLSSDGSSLVYSTYIGGSGHDYFSALDVDSRGNAVITGETSSSDYPTTSGALDPTNGGGYDMMITKLNSLGSSLVYSTYIGGAGADFGHAVYVDVNDNMHFCGETFSTDFPTTSGCYDNSYNLAGDAVACAFNSSGAIILYSTYIGGANWESAREVVADSSGSVYITGFTYSSDFPTTSGAYDVTLGARDAFALKLTSIGSALVYSTFLGGSGDESGVAMALDSSTNVVISGYTTSPDYPTTSGAYDTSFNGGSDTFLTKVNAWGTSLSFSTFIGGSGNEYAVGLCLDVLGNSYVTGETASSDFPTTTNAHDTTYNGATDAFILKVNAAGSELNYSTYFGGTSADGGSTIRFSNGVMYVGGYTESSDFPTLAAYDSTYNGGRDAFAVKISLVTVPDAPTNLQASAGADQVSLSWLAPVYDGGSDITGYNIYRGTSPGGESLLTSIGDQLTYVDSSVARGTTYYYRVSAVNSVGEGSLSNEASTTTPDVPSAPQNPQATPGDRQVTLSWEAPISDGGMSITGYRVYRGTVSGGEVYIASVSGDTYAYTNTGLTNGQKYYYQVSAVNSVGEGPMSAEVDATPATTPTAPRSLQVSTGVDQLELTWQSPLSDGGSSITGYNIYRGTSPGGSLYDSVGVNLTYTDSAVSRGTTYYYRVSALNSVGEGGISSEVSAVVPNVPSAPLNLNATAGDSQVSLTWSAPSSDGGSAITGYVLYRGTSPGGETELIQLDGTIMTYTDTGLTNGVTYYYQVSAENAVGEGARSNEDSAKPGQVPTAPRNLVATSGDAMATLDWDVPLSDGGLPISAYRVYRGTAPGDEALVASADGGTLTYDDTGLTNGVRYYYVVRAVNEVGESPSSTEVTALPATVPSAPQNFEAAGGNTKVTLTWDPPLSDGGLEITDYIVYRGTTAGGETLLLQIDAVANSYADSGLTNGQEYYYQISAVNDKGEGARSLEVSATPSTTAPGVPTSLQAQAGDARVDLSWSAPLDDGGSTITAYRVYRGTFSGGETFLEEVSGSTTSYSDEGLVNGGTYFYQVSATNAIGEGTRTNEVSVVPATVPDVPTNLEIEPGDSQTTLSWGAPSSDGGSATTGYVIYRGIAPGGEITLTAISASETVFVDTGLVNGETYYYQVSAINNVGEGVRCEEGSATPHTTPGPPALTTAKGGDANVTVFWSAPADDGGSPVTGYEVYYGTTTPPSLRFGGVLPSTVRSLTITGIVPGTVYYFRVVAINGAGSGEPSNTLSATPYTIPGPCTVTSVVDVGGGEVRITWLPPDDYQDMDIEVYRIYADMGDGWELIGEVLGQDERQFNFTFDPDPNLLGRATAKFRVTAVNPAGETEDSPVYTLEWNTGVDIVGWLKICIPVITAMVVVLQRRRIRTLVHQMNMSMEEWRKRSAGRKEDLAKTQKDLGKDIKEFSEEREK